MDHAPPRIRGGHPMTVVVLAILGVLALDTIRLDLEGLS